jgi:uncharacterized protein (TIGR03437 family)
MGMRGLLLLGCGLTAAAQNIITTIAGTDTSFPQGPVRATDASLGEPTGLAFDSRGNLLVADPASDLLLRVSPDGQVDVAAGTGIPAFGVNIGENIPATQATLAGLRDAAADPAGAIHTLNNGVIRRIAPDGTIRTILGEGLGGIAEAGTAWKIAIDRSGNIYILETFKHRVHRLSANGALAVYAGTGDAGFSGDGAPATNAQLRLPAAIALDDDGNLLIADTGNDRIRRVEASSGLIRTIQSAPAVTALAVAADGAVLFGGRYLRRLNRDSTVTQLIQERPIGFSGDGGLASAAAVSFIHGIAVGPNGDIYLSDRLNRRVRRINSAGTIATHLGSGVYRFQGDGGPASAALLSSPTKLASDSAGNVVVADFGNQRYRRIRTNGVIETLTGLGSGNVDGTAGQFAPFVEVEGVAVNMRGTDAFFSDHRNHRVRRRGPEGRVTVFAGTGVPGFAGDGGQAAAAQLNQPVAVALGPDGSVYIGDRDNHRVRRVAPDGVIRTVAGNGRNAFAGDGGLATEASIELVSDLAVDRNGVLYIATYGGVANPGVGRVRRVATSGVIQTVGTGSPSVRGIYVAVDAEAANLYFTDGCSVRRQPASGAAVIVAGQRNACGYEGDGFAASGALLAGPAGLAVDQAGNVYIAELLGNRIRKVLAQQPTLTTGARALQFAGTSRGAPPVSQTLQIDGSIPIVPFSIALDDGGRRWLSVEDALGVTPRAMEVSVNPELLAPGTYEGTIRIDTPSATPRSTTVGVRFVVGAPVAPVLVVDRPSITFAYPREAATRSEAVILANGGSGPLPVAVAAVARAGDWLRVTPGQGIATPRIPLQLVVEANPAGLGPGTYTGAILVRTPNQSMSIPVTMMVSNRDHAVQLSQSGLSYAGVQTGGPPPPQEFAVLNTGSGEMAFQASAATLSGGNWLDVSPREGATIAGGTPPSLQVTVNHAGLSPGRYYGQVRIDAPTAANSPHVLTVNLEVLRPDENPGAVIQPAELTFSPTQGGVPGAREVVIYNLTPGPVSFRSAQLDVAILPRDAVVEPGKPLRVFVQPTSLSAESRRAGAFLQFSDGILRRLPVFLRADQGAAAAKRGATACASKELVPALISLGQSLTVPAGWPAGLNVEVKDDCGASMSTGSVTVSFSNGDPPVALTSLRDGRWQGTWQGRGGGDPRVVVHIEAQQPDPNLKGARDVIADLRATQDPPSVPADGIVAGLSPVAFAPLAPGALVAVNGERLTENVTDRASTAPLPTQLAGAEVVMTGRRMPLSMASANRIESVVPNDIAPNTTHQILVRRGTSYSRPVSVNVASAQPGIAATSATVEGGNLVILCSGLGATDPSVDAGAAGPNPPASVRAEVRARVNNADARVVSAVLAPGMVGLYRVTIALPEGVSGDAVPVSIEVAGQVATATVAIRR